MADARSTQQPWKNADDRKPPCGRYSITGQSTIYRTLCVNTGFLPIPRSGLRSFGSGTTSAHPISEALQSRKAALPLFLAQSFILLREHSVDFVDGFISGSGYLCHNLIVSLACPD